MRFINLHYVKRYRMELNLHRWQAPPLRLPHGYLFVPWHNSLVSQHAEVKFRSFCDTLDAQVFPCLGELDGCHRLMSEIKAREGFVPEATWLVEYYPKTVPRGEYCGTIQAVRTHPYRASIQNIGVVPSHRGQGIGRGLILASLLGMQQVGISQISLEVTAENNRAVELYRRVGFRSVRTLYKSVELATCPAGR